MEIILSGAVNEQEKEDFDEKIIRRIAVFACGLSIHLCEYSRVR